MKKTLPWLTAVAAGGLGWLVYGALVEANKLVLERRTLRLPKWPAARNGFRIGLIADLHIRDEYSIGMAKRAIDMLLAEEPDVIVIAGDFVGYWKLQSPWQLEEALKPLAPMRGRILAVPGNHDYWEGDPSLLRPILEEMGITLLRNEAVSVGDVTFLGVDSGNEGMADPWASLEAAWAIDPDAPMVTIWHEPDFVDHLPPATALMLSGHSHGGQWRFPWGWTPMHTKGGTKFVDGFYPDALTPLYVTRGVGTTGPPARLGALAEVSILELFASTGAEGL